MTKIMLDLIALEKHSGPIQDLLEKLGGPNEARYAKKLKAMLRGEDDETNTFTLSSLLEKSYISYFSDNVLKFSGDKVDLEKKCDMSAPKALGKATSEREILKRYPGCAGLSDDKLIAKVKTLAPDFHTVFGQMMRYITSAEENNANGIVTPADFPTTVGTWFVTICLVDGELHTLRGNRRSDGWLVRCSPVELGYEWSAERLLLLATETPTL